MANTFSVFFIPGCFPPYRGVENLGFIYLPADVCDRLAGIGCKISLFLSFKQFHIYIIVHRQCRFDRHRFFVGAIQFDKFGGIQNTVRGFGVIR